MFEAYKKEWEKYYLKPTKYTCDKTKEFLNKFDPFNWKSCSDWQYKDMLKSLSEVWSIYITFWDQTTLGFEWIKSNEIDFFGWNIAFSSVWIEKIYFSIIPNQVKYPLEWLKIEYNKNSNLDFNLYADKWNVNFNFESKLNNDNSFTYIDFIWKSISSYEEFNFSFLLKNNDISWDFKIISKIYDYNTKITQLDKAISWTINWKTNSLDKLDNIEINYIWDSIKDWKFLEWDFSYLNKNFNWKIIFYKNQKELFNINLIWKYDEKYFELNNKFSISEEWLIEIFYWNENWIFKKINWNINILIDQRNNNKNIYMYIDLLLDNIKTLEFNIDNKSTIEYKDVKILIPSDSNIIDLKDIK